MINHINTLSPEELAIAPMKTKQKETLCIFHETCCVLFHGSWTKWAWLLIWIKLVQWPLVIPEFNITHYAHSINKGCDRNDPTLKCALKIFLYYCGICRIIDSSAAATMCGSICKLSIRNTDNSLSVCATVYATYDTLRYRSGSKLAQVIPGCVMAQSGAYTSVDLLSIRCSVAFTWENFNMKCLLI